METQTVATIQRDGYYLRRFAMGEHTGTHLTAPYSFYADGAVPQDYTAAQLVVPAAVLDVRSQCGEDPDYSLTPDDLLSWETEYRRVPRGHLALLYTGWANRWRNPVDYLGADASGRLHFPGFGLEAARLLINERGSVGLGTDTPGAEPGADEAFSVSKLVLAQPRIVLENLTNLGQLPPIGSLLAIGLLRIAGGTGAPAAVTAFVP